MLSKSLTQFSFHGHGCVPFLLSDLKPSYDGGNEDNGDLLQKAPCAHCCTQCPNPAAGHRRPTPLLETHGCSWARLCLSVSCGSLLLSLEFWYTQVLFVPSKSLFPQSCISSGSSMVGLMVTSSKRAYAMPRSTAPRAPAPVAGHC